MHAMLHVRAVRAGGEVRVERHVEKVGVRGVGSEEGGGEQRAMERDLRRCTAGRREGRGTPWDAPTREGCRSAMRVAGRPRRRWLAVALRRRNGLLRGQERARPLAHLREVLVVRMPRIQERLRRRQREQLRVQ